MEQKRSDELPQAFRSKELKEQIKEVLGHIQDDKQRINLTDNEAKFIRASKELV